MLKTLLNKSYGAALEQGEQTLTTKRWEQHAELPGTLKNMLAEIKEREKAFKEQESETHRGTLRAMLGLSADAGDDETVKTQESGA